MRRLGRGCVSKTARCGLGAGFDVAVVCWVWERGRSCGSEPGPAEVVETEPVRRLPLRIAAASDLQSALPEIIGSLPGRTGTAFTPVFLASGNLAEQIKQGAPFDVFMAANESFVRDLADGGFIRPESVHPYARGSLVLAVYRELGDTVRSLADLNKPEVKKIALANPATAPYGKAGKQALERAGPVGEAPAQDRPGRVGPPGAALCQKGDAEAALVGRAIATCPEVRAVEIDPGLYDPIVQAWGS